ncbi:MFS transporter [candidate division KSB1 bacterium]
MEPTIKNLKFYVLLIACLTSFLTPFMGSSINIALPAIGKEFHADAITQSWVATAYILSAAVFLVPFGRMADILGRKRIFTTGIFIFTLSSIFSGMAWSIEILILSRVIQAIGSAMIFGTGLAIITTVFPPEQRGRAMGVNIAAVYIGLAVGPSAGGFLTSYWGWRSIFFAVIPLGLLIIIILITKLKIEWADAKGEKFDWLGSFIYAITLVLLMYGFSSLPKWSGFAMIVTGLITLYLFMRIELKTTTPIMNIRIFKKNKTFTFSNIAALINYSATFAVGFLLSLYLQYIKGLNARDAGLVLVAQPIVMALFSPLMGRLSDKIEPRIVASIGMTITSVGLFMLIYLKSSTTIAYLTVVLIILGLGFAFFSSPNTNAIMSSVEKKFLGVASGTVGTMRLLGQMFSLGIATLIFAVFIGREEINPANFEMFIRSVNVAFLVFAILCFAGIFASLARGKIR